MEQQVDRCTVAEETATHLQAVGNRLGGVTGAFGKELLRAAGATAAQIQREQARLTAGAQRMAAQNAEFADRLQRSLERVSAANANSSPPAQHPVPPPAAVSLSHRRRQQASRN